MKLIVSVSEEWGIGYRGELLFRISADLKRFKALTTGNVVILGRKTMSTFPGGRPLAGRENIVLTRDAALEVPGAHTCASLASLQQTLLLPPCAGKEAYVIGGAEIYALLLPYCEAAFITHVRAQASADAYLPRLDVLPGWSLFESGPEQEENGLRFCYAGYRNASPRSLPRA